MFLDFEALELTDQKTELQNIAGGDGSILIEKVFDTKDITERLNLNASLSSWFRYKSNDRVDYVIQKIIESQGNVSINSICQSLGLLASI